MYYDYFGLSRPPFKITPDTDVFFAGGKRGDILDALLYAIGEGEGIVKVTGEVGSGKTMLCRMLETRLPSHVETIYIANPGVPPEEILQAIAFELQLPISSTAGRIEVMHTLNRHLLDRHSRGKQVVMFVEESQGMPIETLEEIRLLSNLETKQDKLLQILLFGQPELDQILAQPKIRQLRERITHSFFLAPLSKKDVYPYILFRLQAAGYRGPDLFNRRVVDLITRSSGGLTRRINIIADKALMAAFADGTHNITVKHVKAAIGDSAFCTPSPRPLHAAPFGYILGGLAVGGALGAAAFAAFVAMTPVAVSPLHPVTPGIKEESIIARQPAIDPAPSRVDRPSVPVEPSGATEADKTVSETGSREMASIAPALATVSSPAPLAEAPASPQAAFAPPSTGVSETQPASPDLVEQRLVATRKWLAETDADCFSIQLMIVTRREKLLHLLSKNPYQLEMDRIFVYPTLAGKQPCVAVLYGSYASRAEVGAAIENLSPELKTNQPCYRTVKGIRAEIASRET